MLPAGLADVHRDVRERQPGVDAGFANFGRDVREQVLHDAQSIRDPPPQGSLNIALDDSAERLSSRVQ